MKLHKGIDIASPCGTPVYCAGNGRVIRSGYDRGYGKFLEVRHAGGFATRYAHLDNVQVRQGDPVRIGEQIATVGHSGLATGDHLHFEIRKNGTTWNPFEWFECLRLKYFFRRLYVAPSDY